MKQLTRYFIYFIITLLFLGYTYYNEPTDYMNTFQEYKMFILAGVSLGVMAILFYFTGILILYKKDSAIAWFYYVMSVSDTSNSDTYTELEDMACAINQIHKLKDNEILKVKK